MSTKTRVVIANHAHHNPISMCRQPQGEETVFAAWVKSKGKEIKIIIAAFMKHRGLQGIMPNHAINETKSDGCA